MSVTRLKQPGQEAPPSPDRAELKAAIAERDAAKQALQSVEKAAQRAKSLLESAQAEVAGLGDVEAAIGQQRVDQIRAGTQPNISPALLDRKRAVVSALENVEASHAAVAQLTGEAEGGKQMVIERERVVHQAAAAVVSARCSEIAAELMDAHKRVRSLSQLLESAEFEMPHIAGTPPARPETFQFPKEAGVALGMRFVTAGIGPTCLPAGSTLVIAAAQQASDKWRDWFTRLCTDCNAAEF